jgi:hypothetical protein
MEQGKARHDVVEAAARALAKAVAKIFFFDQKQKLPAIAFLLLNSKKKHVLLVVRVSDSGLLVCIDSGLLVCISD